jgi:hypothetical protein
MRMFGQRAAMAVAAIALGSAAFAGTALAGEGHEGAPLADVGHNSVDGSAGDAGHGGSADKDCNPPVGAATGGGGSINNVECTVYAGHGGDGGHGAEY